VFQDEIKRFFEGAGTQAGWLQLRQLDKEMLISVIDRLVTAARKMAEERIGALLVIEREVGLNDYVDTENVLEAKLTVDHLRTIFHPTTPMHDGAVLVRGDRIAAARVFLPLSDNPRLDPELGTRHRAGLGITEQSDAVVIIVSEEKGQISLAAGGRLVLNIQPEALRQQLKALLLPGGTPVASAVTSPPPKKTEEESEEEETEA
jgi:diadenylate cyclase